LFGAYTTFPHDLFPPPLIIVLTNGNFTPWFLRFLVPILYALKAGLYILL
jgi:hypothetical protein